MSKLAINGGKPVRKTLLPNQRTTGPEEAQAVMRVMESGCLTGYQGNWSQAFYGGPEIRALEEEFAAWNGSKHAIACNSATSGLFIACAALRLDGLDNVAVTPWSMSCSATVPLWFGCFPIFGDIDPDIFCLSPNITSTCRIIVDLFGHPATYRDKDGLSVPVIEDAAQALGATRNGIKTGNLGDIGVFSFNQGKHITCGEGGMIATSDAGLAMRCRLVMNHAEAVVHGMPPDKQAQYADMVGLNLRMTEMQAAIVRSQLRRLDEMLAVRLANVHHLQAGMQKVPFIRPAAVQDGCTHTYYCFPWHYDQEEAGGIHRDRFVEAVRAELQPCEGREHEGVPIRGGYIEPLYRFPVFQPNDIHLPVVERLQRDELFILHRLFGIGADTESLDDVIRAFHKVAENMRELSQ